MPLQIQGVKLYTIKETAKAFRCHHNTIRRYLRTGELQGHRIGRSIYITEEQIKDFKQRNRYDYREFVKYDMLMDLKRKNTAELKLYSVYVLNK